jgi:hypothetical protein
MSGAEEDKKMPLLEHLVELVRACCAAVDSSSPFACFFVAQHILDAEAAGGIAA